MNKKFVYADNAATTKVSSSVLDAMMPYLTEHYGNASSIYSIGRNAKKAVELSREKISKCLGCEPSELYFTSGGSEADNWAIKSVCEKFSKKGNETFSSGTYDIINNHSISLFNSIALTISIIRIPMISR